MTTLNYKILPTRRKASGKLGIYLAVSHKKQVRYISTEFEIDDEFQFQDGKVCYRKDAAIMNKRMQFVMDEYIEKLKHINPAKYTTCAAIKDALTSTEQQPSIITIESMYMEKLQNLKERGQKSHYTAMLYSYKAVTEVLKPDTPVVYITPNDIRLLEERFIKKGLSNSTIGIYMWNLKMQINELIESETVEMKNPFRKYIIPASPARIMDINRDDFRKVIDSSFAPESLQYAKDMWLLSFYLGGMNLEDLRRTALNDEKVTFISKKTEAKERGTNKQIVFTIVPEAREIINRYINPENGLLQLRGERNQLQIIDPALKSIQKKLNIEGRLSFYSARKTFAQFSFELGIRTEVIEYCLGQSMKSNRPVYNYVRVMQKYADEAIRAVIDYAHGRTGTEASAM